MRATRSGPAMHCYSHISPSWGSGAQCGMEGVEEVGQRVVMIVTSSEKGLKSPAFVGLTFAFLHVLASPAFTFVCPVFTFTSRFACCRKSKEIRYGQLVVQYDK